MVRWTAMPICPNCEAIMGYEENTESWDCTECDASIADSEFDDN